MATYSVSLQGTPTSEITQNKRTYRVRFKICTNENVCDLYPAKINATLITYPSDPCGGPPPLTTPIPSSYDLSFWGCPDETDSGAVLTSSSLVDEKADPSQEDLDELAEFSGDGASLGTEGTCVVCRFYDFVYEADLVDGRSVPEDIAENSCPEISIEPYVTQQRVNKATFKGFWRPVKCCTENGTPHSGDTQTAAPAWGFLQANNTPESCDEIIRIAEDVLNQTISAAFDEYLETRSIIFSLATSQFLTRSAHAALEDNEKSYKAAVEAAYTKFNNDKQACLDAAAEAEPCWSMVSGTCVSPILPNGTPLDIVAEKTEEVIRVRHYATDLGPTDLFRSATNTVNCLDFGISIPCQNFSAVWPAETLYLRFVRHNSTLLNGSRIWIREYEFHYSPDGWDTFVKNEGVEHAVCLETQEGKPYLAPGGSCVDGTFTLEDCVDQCPSLPGTAAILDSLGHPLRTPISLDFNGQANCDQDSENYTRWEPQCCSDFTLLPIPQITNIDEERDGNTPPGGPTDPTIPCSETNEDNTWIVFYKGDQCTHTFTCTDVPPFGWVLTSSVGEDCP